MSKVKKKTKKFFSAEAEAAYRRAFGRRVRLIRVVLGMNQTEMSAILGRANNDAVSRLERGEAEMLPFDVLDALGKLALKAGHDAAWLFAFPTTVDLADVPVQATQAPFRGVKVFQRGYEIAPAESLPKDWRGRWVPILGKVAAGAGIDTVEAESHPTGIADKYVRWDWRCENPAAVQVAGESMLPDFHPEDLVVFDLDVQVESGLAVIRFQEKGEDLVRLKRLRRTRGRILLESLNPKFKTVELAPHRLVASWKVVDHLPFMREG